MDNKESARNPIVGGDGTMSPKELLYIEDALGHEQFLKQQCQNAVQQLQDQDLKNCVEQLVNKHQQIFNAFYGLV